MGRIARHRLATTTCTDAIAWEAWERVALGSVDALCQDTSAALAAPVAELEHAVRPAVLWRKQSLGTKTEAGNRFVAHILSVARVPACGCCQQQRSFLEYLTAACSAQQHGQPIPSLLPAPP